MPLVPKRHGSSQNSHHHFRRRAAIDTSHGFSLANLDGINVPNDERDIVPSLQNAETELNHAFVLGTGLFIFLILGYLSRRQIRSTLSRLRHPLSAYGSASQFIQIHLHAVHYSPLHDRDTIMSPIESESGNVDIESLLHANEEPAPPYSPQPVQISSMRERRSKRSLHITVPAVQAILSQANGSSQGQGSSGAITEAESSVSTTSDASSQAERTASSRARSLSNAGVLEGAAPILSKFNAYFRPYRHVSITSHDGKSTAASGGDAPCLSTVSNRSESLMSTGSPCATPPPQYTITIHSSHRLTRCDSAGRLASVPDIVLSPVPWLPREHVPQSPPHYLTIPSRKSRSRRRRAELDSKVDQSKTLPATPLSQAEKRSKRVKNSEIKVRHVFSTPIAPQAPLSVPKNVVPDVSVTPTTPKAQAPKPKQQLARCATYPLQKRALPPLPPPRPVLPMDLEAVYPTSCDEEDETAAKTENSSWSGGESTDSWRWPNWPIGQTVAAPIQDRGSGPTDMSSKQTSEGTYGTYSSEKGVYMEKTKVDWKMGMDNASDSDKVPLAQELLSAMRKGKLALETQAGRGREAPVGFDVSQALRKGLFGGLSALAAKARMVIERELDSDEEVEDSEEEVERRVKGDIRHRNFVAREMEVASAFVIGEED